MRAFIRHRAALILAVGGLLLSAPGLQAQDGDTDSVAYHSLLLRLCQATDMEKQMGNGVAFIVKSIRGGEALKFDTSLIAGKLRCVDIVRAVAPIYQQRFTYDELLDVVLLFECPDLRSRYHMLAQDTASGLLLGNDLTREKLVSIEGCTSHAASSGVDIWFDLHDEFRPLVGQEIILLVKNAFGAELDRLMAERKGMRGPLLTSEQIQADVANLPSKKYADIVRCLKGAGFRDFIALTLLQSVEKGAVFDKFSKDKSAEYIEDVKRLTELMVARLSEDSLINVVAPVFHEFFTDKEMKQLADFYQTKAGKSYVQIKLRQYREPEKLTEIFMEEFDKLTSKEQDRLIAFRETAAADKFIMQSPELSAGLYNRLQRYFWSMMDDVYIDLIEDADSNE